MAPAKKDVRIEELVRWDDYAGVPAQQSLPAMYKHAEDASERARSWYWRSIHNKKISSMLVRGVGFGLLVIGAVSPLVAALSSDPQFRLASTQFGVITLAIAGLLHSADRIFGWSSGWLRYISTVTTMESVTRRFELEWANYAINKAGGLDDTDKRPLFDLARKMEEEILKLQSDETEKWVAEFNSGLAVLSDLIKSQREAAEKNLDAARASIEKRDAAAGEREKADRPGGIELAIVHKADVVPVRIRLDDGPELEFAGTVWAWKALPPGQHTVEVRGTSSSATVRKIANVLPAAVAAIEVRLS